MFIPFSGWLFNRAKVAQPGRATSPPYDVISELDREDLLSRSAHNIIRLLLPGRDEESYRRAGELLREWRTTGVLVRDDEPRFYVYEIESEEQGGAWHTASGVLGALRLADFGAEIVPHEETVETRREGRMEVLEATRANIDPILALTASPELPALLSLRGRLRLAFNEEDGTRHRVFDITDSDLISSIASSVADHPVSLADGHHRYTTAHRYRAKRRAETGDGPWDHILAMISSGLHGGFKILPYHRVLPYSTIPLDAVARDFDVSPTAPEAPRTPGTLVIFDGHHAYSLVPKPESLGSLPWALQQSSTAVASHLFYPLAGLDEQDARYTPDDAKAVAMTESGKRIAVLVAPLSATAIAAAGEAGLVFPTKSTFFVPKPRAGLVVRSLTD